MCSAVYGCIFLSGGLRYGDILSQKATIPYAILVGCMPPSLGISEIEDEIRRIWEWHMLSFCEHNQDLFARQSEVGRVAFNFIPEIVFCNVPNRVYVVNEGLNSFMEKQTDTNSALCRFERRPKWELSRVLDIFLANYGLGWKLQDNKLFVFRNY
jgi:hypothetical protein